MRWSWLAAAASQGLSRCAAGFQRAQVSVMESGRIRSGRGPGCPASLTLGVPKQVPRRTWWPLRSFLTGLGCPSGPHSPHSPLQTPLQEAPRCRMHCPGLLAPAWPPGRGPVTLCFHAVPERLFLYLLVALLHTCLTLNRMPGIPVHHQLSLLRLTSIESVMPSSHLTLCRPLLLLPPIPPSNKVFSSESTLHMRWPKYWSFSFSISPSNEHPGLISFRMDWLDLLAVQGTLKSLLQNHSSKASILLHSAFFTVQLSHSYMITGKTIALTRRTFVGKVMSAF